MPNNFNIKSQMSLMSDSLSGKSYVKENAPKTFVVIHNMAGTLQGTLAHWNSGSAGAYTSAHYCVDDKEIHQTLLDGWKGHHCGAASGPAGQRGCNNNTSIGIEIADMNTNQKEAMENGIELARFLLDKYNIPYENLVSHKEVTNCYK